MVGMVFVFKVFFKYIDYLFFLFFKRNICFFNFFCLFGKLFCFLEEIVIVKRKDDKVVVFIFEVKLLLRSLVIC